MSYVPPHARKQSVKSAVVVKQPQINIKDEFPTLNTKPINNVTSPALNFSNLFKDIEEPSKEIKDEIEKGYIKLTKNGIVDSLTKEERDIDNNNKLNKAISNNMKSLYNKIEIQKQKRMLWDDNYEPEIVIDEYSSSNYSSSDESEEYAEDPDDEINEL